MEDLQKRLERVTISVGDIIVDCVNSDIGILVRRKVHIDMLLDEICMWEIRWINKSKQDVPMIGYIEEESLRLSIAVGTYEWHSIEGESFEI